MTASVPGAAPDERPCTTTREHLAHRWMIGRRLMQCPGVPSAASTAPEGAAERLQAIHVTLLNGCDISEDDVAWLFARLREADRQMREQRDRAERAECQGEALARSLEAAEAGLREAEQRAEKAEAARERVRALHAETHQTGQNDGIGTVMWVECMHCRWPAPCPTIRALSAPADASPLRDLSEADPAARQELAALSHEAERLRDERDAEARRANEAEAALERVRSALLQGGQTAEVRANAALAALSAPADASGEGLSR